MFAPYRGFCGHVADAADGQAGRRDLTGLDGHGVRALRARQAAARSCSECCPGGALRPVRAEWDQARQGQCHEEDGDTVYVILRVFEADVKPRIGDVLVDPFAAHRPGEVRLAERDLWVTVSPRKPIEGAP
jgi:hypothetical protein